ncbi:pyridoxamine 5'-phosphate oxidase family protein [Bacillota bacterium LX-D]|nr:pyridoxamine 5'-phosphate oxidase family protein [Bacillota bacterium LX-D]
MEEVLKFLTENPTFYFATVDGDKPRVRPFGFFMEYEGKLYFGMGNHKQSYKQLTVNPNVEVCTTNSKGEWIRIKGKVVFDKSQEALDNAFKTMPDLKKIYNEQTGQTLAVCYLTEAEAEIADMSGGFKKITLS